MKQCLLPFFIALTFSAHAQVWRWGTGSDVPAGNIESWPMAADTSGNIYETGTTSGVLIGYFGPDTISSLSAFVVVSMDTGGHYRWARNGSSGAAAVCNMVTDTRGDLYLFGWYQASLTIDGVTITAPSSSSATAFCARLTTGGNVQWIRNVADSVSTSCFGGLDSSGNFYVTGSFTAKNFVMGAITLPNHSSHTDVYVAKLDTAFNVVWAHSFGGNLNELPKSAVVTAAGDMYSGGMYFSDSLFIGSDTLPGPAFGSWYFYLAKYDPEGSLAWYKAVKTQGNDNFGSISLDASENVFFTGGYETSLVIDNDSITAAGYGVFLSKIKSSGAVLWLKQVNVPELLQGWAVMPDVFNNIWLAGAYHTNSTPIDSMYILQLDDTAGVKSQLLLASGGDDASALLVDNKGSLFIGGDYEVDSFVVGNDTLHLMGGSQETLFAAKYCYQNCYSSTGTMVPARQHLDIYPNPAEQIITVCATENITGITIIDLSGRVLMRETGKGTTQQLDVSTLCSGMYLIRVTGEDGSVAVRKFVKE